MKLEVMLGAPVVLHLPTNDRLQRSVPVPGKDQVVLEGVTAGPTGQLSFPTLQ